MVALAAQSVALTYRLPRQFSLAQLIKRRRAAKASGGISASIDTRQGTLTALHDISFSLSAGDRLGLVGPNGAGKTTLLKVLFGVYEPSRGRVISEGRIDALFNIRLGFRSEATGRRNIMLRGLLNGWTPEQIKEREADIIAFADLGDFIDLPLSVYSAGMATRLAFSIATTLEPEILLMDEWIGAGDADFRAKAQVRMAQMAEKAGIIVLASHSVSLIRRTCNKVLRLEKGRVAACVPIEEWIPDKDTVATDPNL